VPYSKEVFDAATARLAGRRQAAEAENEHTKRQLYAKIPRLAAIERELAQTGIKAAHEIIMSDDTAASIARLRRINLNLQAERAELLSENGYPHEILAVNYYCGKCRDTGYVDDRICTCLKSLLLEEACKRANSGSPLPLFDFGTFDLKFYPETELSGQKVTVRDYMSRVYAHCRSYASGFSGTGGSLLLLGATGLGKTHLALAIANSVLGRGYGVIYDTAQNIFVRVEEEYFGRGTKKYTEAVYTCDLLILDELPDYASAFTINTFYNIINTRTLSHRPMIVSTNLTEAELSSRYGEKIFSRLIGDFMMLKFFGSDIRQLKLRQKGGF
jgi:DNA replication protein DnaC